MALILAAVYGHAYCVTELLAAGGLIFTQKLCTVETLNHKP